MFIVGLGVRMAVGGSGGLSHKFALGGSWLPAEWDLLLCRSLSPWREASTLELVLNRATASVG